MWSDPASTFLAQPAYVPEVHAVHQHDPSNTFVPTLMPGAPLPAAMPVAPTMMPLAAPMPVAAPIMPVAAPMPIAPPMPIAEPQPIAPVVEPSVVAPRAPGAWATYDHLGLGAPKPSKQRVGKLIVSLYRLLGFSILTIIVVVLVGYIVTTTFYYLNTTWITPIAISTSDEKVVSLEAQLAERQNLRDKLANDLADADRAIAQQQAYQIEFGKAIESDLAGRKRALQSVRWLAGAAAGTRAHITSTNQDYAAQSKVQAERDLEAHLITRDQMLANKYQLAQIEGANFSIAERQAELEQRAAELALQSTSLATLLDRAANKAPLSYDVLRIKQEYDNSKLALDKLIGARETLKASLVREDRIVEGLKASSYLRAINDQAAVAFVPYSNMHSMAKGDELFGCKLGMVMCRKVGTVLEVLAGEVSFKHPHRDKMMRGQMVELKLEDKGAAEDDVLFVGAKPLWL